MPIVNFPDITPSPHGPIREPTDAWASKLAGRPVVDDHHNTNPDVAMPPSEWSGKVYASRGLGATSLLFQVLNRCYDHHHRVALRPEVVWFMISNTVATCVKKNPDDYAAIFTTTPGTKQKVVVSIDHFVYGRPNDWAAGISQFDAKMRELVPSNIPDLMLPDFSTADANANVALLVSFLDAASPFYDYGMSTCCGFPAIRVDGTVEDWQAMVDRVPQLAAKFPPLDAYFFHVLGVLKRIVRTLEHPDDPDMDFWRSMFKIGGGSGGPYINGWITSFIGYTEAHDGQRLRKPESLAWSVTRSFGGLTTGDLPSHVATVPFEWDYLGTKIPMLWQAGVMGCEVIDGFYTPTLGFRVLETVPDDGVLLDAQRERGLVTA